jgi:hypothetical protein
LRRKIAPRIGPAASDLGFDSGETRPARVNLTLATPRRRNFVKTIMQGIHAYFLFLIDTEMKAQKLLFM